MTVACSSRNEEHALRYLWCSSLPSQIVLLGGCHGLSCWLDTFPWRAFAFSPGQAVDRIADLLRPFEDITLKVAPESQIWNKFHRAGSFIGVLCPWASPSRCSYYARPFIVGSSTTIVLFARGTQDAELSSTPRTAIAAQEAVDS